MAIASSNNSIFEICNQFEGIAVLEYNRPLTRLRNNQVHSYREKKHNLRLYTFSFTDTFEPRRLIFKI